MIFASVGSIKQNAIRKRALANMFLFDNTVDRNLLRSKNNLLGLAPECRSMAYSYEKDGVKTTPIGGVKGNKFYPVFSGPVSQFAMGASNLNDYHTIDNPADGLTSDERSNKFVTISETYSTGTMTSKTASLFGGAGSSPNSDITALPDRSRFYLLPASRNSLYYGKELIATPYFDGQMKSFKAIVGSYTYQQMFSAGAYEAGSYVSRTGATVSGQDTFSAVYGAGTEVAIVSSNFLTLNSRYLFVNAQYLYGLTTQSGWSKNSGYITSLTGMKTSAYPFFRLSSTPDDPDCSFVAGAARYSYALGLEVIIVDIGDSSSADMKQTGKTIAEPSMLTLQSDAVKAVLTPKTVIPL